VEGLLSAGTTDGAVPHVGGVRLADGGECRADVVVDASGRRSPLPTWLRGLGAAPLDEEEEDTGIVYSSRFYRLRPGMDVPYQGGLVVADLGYLKYAVFGGDNGTFSITFGLYADDREMRQLLSPGPFTTAAAALVGTRPWVEPARAEPITGVEVMAKLINRRRRLMAHGQPLATGIFPVGDSSICTNPLYGRGCSLAVVQAYLLADVLAGHAGDPAAAAHAFDAATRAEIEPWYRAATDQDRTSGDDGGPDMASLVRDGLLPAARTDPVVFRAFVRSFNLLQPPGAIMSDPVVVKRVLAAWQARDSRPPSEALGPERDELLRILAEAAA
jgi:2-polyprenyl-6-methoxyphenol hydroxylase-like FAD-dependent oxidoreductase